MIYQIAYKSISLTPQMIYDLSRRKNNDGTNIESTIPRFDFVMALRKKTKINYVNRSKKKRIETLILNKLNRISGAII